MIESVFRHSTLTVDITKQFETNERIGGNMFFLDVVASQYLPNPTLFVAYNEGRMVKISWSLHCFHPCQEARWTLR